MCNYLMTLFNSRVDLKKEEVDEENNNDDAQLIYRQIIFPFKSSLYLGTIFRFTMFTVIIIFSSLKGLFTLKFVLLSISYFG